MLLATLPGQEQARAEGAAMTVLDWWSAISAAGICVSAIITAVSVRFVARQIADQRHATQAQFVYQLDKELSDFGDLFRRVQRGESLADATDPRSATRQRLLESLDFFDRVKTLLDLGVVDLPTVDRVLGGPFFLLVNAPAVQEAALFPDDDRFFELFALHQQLTAFRLAEGRRIPLVETDLARRNPDLYQTNLDRYRRFL
jgi:hypothetical protein